MEVIAHPDLSADVDFMVALDAGEHAPKDESHGAGAHEGESTLGAYADLIDSGGEDLSSWSSHCREFFGEEGRKVSWIGEIISQDARR
jgi:hypothetical protein